MPLLLSSAELPGRRAAAVGALAPLADGLSAELTPLLAADIHIPADKAVLTRAGGRCTRDGAQLDFDPFSPRVHRCPVCGERHEGDAHHRMWIMWYQLWLAERAVHAATLHLLRDDARFAALAIDVLRRLADAYPTYPNRDNALGPTRPFFSTYLESIWLLQICVALDLLEMAGGVDALGGIVRDRVIQPSRALIASFDESGSNRQVWNAAAMFAASLLLDDRAGAEQAARGPAGVASQLERGLLTDGTWYEGENYHQFAHRGLWYGVTMMEHAGLALPDALLARFQEGFATPWLAALPDLTLPSRRDSQYAISLRQWRYAEMFELGLARSDDARLAGALHALYSGAIDRRPTGRDRSAAEAERNAPASALSRADLGWRSLLHALPELPPLAPSPPRSVLLEGQGLAILRRDAGRVWVGLDYGHSGGGHGHPDRLDLLLSVGDVRWLDDVGTGSYVDRSLHWYRSTLAHNAPLVDGRSQARVRGELGAWDERGGAGWVRGEVSGIAPGVEVERTIIALPDYFIDVLEWRADRERTLDLPVHIDGELVGVTHWRDAALAGGDGLEDGFEFVGDAERAERGANGAMVLQSQQGTERMAAHVHAAGAQWWRATAPGAPGRGERSFFLLRQRGTEGVIVSAWSWRSVITSLDVGDESLVIELTDGARHRHFSLPDRWRILFESGGGQSSIDLQGIRDRVMPAGARPAVARVSPAPVSDPAATPALVVPHRLDAAGWLFDQPCTSSALRIELGEGDYRRSEESWRDAGSPRATMVTAAANRMLEIEVTIHGATRHFIADGAENPFDNEHADLDGDGVQLYIASGGTSTDGAGPPDVRGWVLVPQCDSTEVRARPIAGLGGAAAPRAEWRPTADGYAIRARIPFGDLLGGGSSDHFRLGVAINHITPGRERRAGQLVLGGARGEWAYLRGDRLPADRLLAFVLAND